MKRYDKFVKISEESIKQCGRTDKININKFLDFNELSEVLSKHDFCIFAYENEDNLLKDVILKLKDKKIEYNDIAIIIGPEGGFNKTEVDTLASLDNVYVVSLGKRILRAETATINLISIIMYEFE